MGGGGEGREGRGARWEAPSGRDRMGHVGLADQEEDHRLGVRRWEPLGALVPGSS